VLVGVAAPQLAAADPTEPLTLDNFVRPSQECSTCHLFVNPPQLADEPNISPQAWQGTLMGQSARDPVFWAAVPIAHQDAPGETADCIRCHSPKAFLDGRGDALAITDLTTDDLDGVTCELCHRMVDDGVTPAGNARYVIDDEDVDGAMPMRGPWTYPDDNKPQHPTSDQNTFIASSRMCGTCHDVTTARERVDANGVGLGIGFGEQRTYSEWLGSAFSDPQDPNAQTCQDCHMPALDDVAGCDGFSLANNTHPTGGRRHDLTGANIPIIDLLQKLYGKSSGGPLEDALFDIARDRTVELLTTAASLDVDFPMAIDLEAPTEVPVTVTNNTGHKLPTGYAEGRVMWLEVTAHLGDQLIWSSGLYDPQTREIEDDPQIRRYEAIAEDHSDGTTLHLLRSDRWLVDNRVPPRGMHPDLETDPVGDRYTLNEDNVWPHTDAVTFEFAPLALEDPTPGVEDTVDVRVRLMYLINTGEYLDLLAEDNATNAAGTDLLALFDTHGSPEPVVLGEQLASVPVSGFVEPEPETSSTAGPTTGSGETMSTASTTLESTGSSSGVPLTDSGSGTDTAEADDGGCGCRASAHPVPPLLAVGLLLVGLRRRRQTI